MKLHIDDADTALLDALAEDILQPDIIGDAIERAVAQLAPGARKEEADRLRAELASVQRSVSNLTDALAAGGELTSLIERLKAEELGRLDLEARIATADHLAQVLDVGAIRARLRPKVSEWRDLLRQRAAMAQSRQMLRKMLDGPVTLTELPDGGGVALAGRATYERIFEGILPVSPNDLARPKCVASPGGLDTLCSAQVAPEGAQPAAPVRNAGPWMFERTRLVPVRSAA